MEFVIAAALGLALGARHAFEPDHLAAVSTLMAERPRPRQAALQGALWGLGHTAALVAVGVALILARAELAPAVERGLELAVAIMLIGLGVRGVRAALRDGGDGPLHVHAHGGRAHAHHGPTGHVHVGGHALALRPLLVGVLHGLAGSGALAALAMGEVASSPAAIGYVVAFGLGSIAGMTAVAALAAVSLARLTVSPRALRRLRVGSGAAAIVVGLAWGALALA